MDLPISVSKIEWGFGPGNLLNPESMARLQIQYQAAEDDRNTRLILTQAKGNELFCLGLDPQAMLATDALGRSSMFSQICGLMHQLLAISKPHIIFLDGAAMGGGALLAMTADFRYWGSHGSMSFTGSKVGMPTPKAFWDLLGLHLSPTKTQELILLGSVVHQDQAIEYGLSNGDWSDGERAIRRLTRFHPEVMAASRHEYRKQAMGSMKLLVDNREFDRFLGEGYLLEGLTAMEDKRYPNFAQLNTNNKAMEDI